jgi:UDP-N-acetylmuramoyl-L-alanyl-D-glutamate--2,6-diaminopimelate ligase
MKLFKKLEHKKCGIGVFNLNDENVEHFLSPVLCKKYGYTISREENKEKYQKLDEVISIRNINLHASNTEFDVNGHHFDLPLIGTFNVQNVGAAMCVALSQGISLDQVRKSLEHFQGVPGRMEVIKNNRGFSVIVDYAHEPKSLESVYKAITESKLKQEHGKLICMFGATGGGRDRWKRPVMGEIAARYCDEIILTNDDPYDEDQKNIIKEIRVGIDRTPLTKGNIYEIVDRREAIRKAIALAKPGDAVVLTGKGGESVMVVENEKRIPWDESKFVEEDLKNLK